MTGDPLKIAIKGTTQDHLSIEDVVGDIVLLKDGSCAQVLQVSSVNFDLLSEKEQLALVYAYGGILNSLNFPIQIVVRTKTKDISQYLSNLKGYEAKQNNPLLKERIKSYQKFVEETVKKNDVLSKLFYIAIPFLSIELGLGAMMPKGGKTSFDKKYVLEKAKASLEPKKDHLLRLFSRIGLEIKALDNKELIELFYSIYNEDVADSQKVENLNYETPMVATKLKNE